MEIIENYMKKTLITGITGQDGSFLAKFLLQKGYEVHGIKRRASSFNTERIDYLYQDPHEENARFFLHYGDLSDSTNLIRIINKVQPDEIYNLGAQSHVQVSFETPEYTADVDGLGTLRLLEAIRILGMEKKVRFYQASTSELFGKVQEIPQKEITPFYPRSPYACAKLFAYWIVVNYRESYGMHPKFSDKIICYTVSEIFFLAFFSFKISFCMSFGHTVSGSSALNARSICACFMVTSPQ